MSEKLIGVDVTGPTVGQVLRRIERSEAHGIPVAWMTTGGVRLDPLTTFVAAAGQTQRIKFGTSIIPTYPRHPLVVAQQARVLEKLAPGRLRLGVGPSHRPSMEELGINFEAPLANLSEYLHILKSLLQTGKVDFDGDHYSAHEELPRPLNTPVMASALRKGSFELCGAEADGAISWICPHSYLRDVALPAMEAGAARAGRPMPPLIAHAPVSVHENAQEVREGVRQRLMNPRLPFYQRMMRDAGYPEASNGEWSDAMIDGVAIWGDADKVSKGLEELFSYGATEVLATPIPAGPDEAASIERTISLLGKLASTN